MGSDVKPAANFDGEQAYDFVAGLVASGGVTHRVPGTSGHAAAADWLEDQMAVPGWDTRRITFTGAELDNLDFGDASGYRTHGAYCKDEDQSRLANLTMWNLEATWDAPETDHVLLLGAHWDSKAEASMDARPERRGDPVPGANDGASGVGLLLQFMHHVAHEDVRPATDLRLVFFDAEDGFEDCHPVAGSTHYAEHHGEGVDRMILLDMVGDPEARFVIESRSDASDPDLRALIWQAAGDHPSFTTTTKPVLDDHVPFIHRGIPAVDIIDYGRPDTGHGFPPYWHTTQDNMDIIDASMLTDVGNVIWRVVSDEAVQAAAAS